MKASRATRAVASIAAVAALCAVAAPSSAITIDIAGGFTNFYTPYAYSHYQEGQESLESYVNGQQLCPENLNHDPTVACQVAGQASVDFEYADASGNLIGAPVQSVEFHALYNDGTTSTVWTPNVVSFAPATGQQVTGFGASNPFLLGTLTFSNGIWTVPAGTGAVSPLAMLSFNLTAVTDDAALNQLYDFEVSGTLQLMGTGNSAANTPEQNADYLFYTGDPELGSIRAYELADSPTGSNTVSVDIYGYLDSLHILRFADATGGGFIGTGTGADPSPVPVPEPATTSLLALGVAGLFGARLRRGRAAARSGASPA